MNNTDDQSISLSIKEITDFDCPRKAVLTILLKMSNINRNQEIKQPNKYMLAGTITHDIWQRLLIKGEDLVNYFHETGYSVEESIKKTLLFYYDEWNQFLSSSRFNNAYKFSEDITTILNRVENQFNKLIKFSLKFFCFKEKKLKSLIIGSEYRVIHVIDEKYILIGKIDLIGKDTDQNIVLLELKTGKSRYSLDKDRNQVQSYIGSIRQHLHNKSVIGELWYTNTEDHRKMPVKIKNDDGILLNIEDMIRNIDRIQQISDLPPANTSACGYFCKLCDELDALFSE